MVGARAVGNDITALKHAEVSLQKAHDELEQKIEERTFELKNEIKERNAVEKELRATTKELQNNVEELRRAEHSVWEHAREMDILNQIIRASNEATDIASLATLLVDHTIDLMDFDAGALFLLNKAENVTELQYARGYPPDYSKERARVSIDEPHVTMLCDHQPLWPEHVQFPPQEVVEREHVTAIAVVPLIARGRVIGSLPISSRRRYKFTGMEKDLLLAIGREAGTAIQPSRTLMEPGCREGLRVDEGRGNRSARFYSAADRVSNID